VGRGVRAGVAYGSSDRIGAYPRESPVSPGDLTATLYHLAGITPGPIVADPTGRRVAIAHDGSPICGVRT
jgi:hypothetical protein